MKQGGIYSPVLFNVYKDHPNRSNIEGHIGGGIVNHLSYAGVLSGLPFISRSEK